MGRKIIDITGQRFGRLTVVARRRKNAKDSHPVWDCICDCGTPWSVSGRNLKDGSSRSCGCFRRDVSRNRMADVRKLRHPS